LRLAAGRAVAAVASGCAALDAPPVPPGRRDEPLVQVAPPPKGTSGGVFVRDTAWSRTADSRAFRPGDVVTVVLDEATQASKKADTSFGKGSSVDVKPITIAGKVLKTDIGLAANRDFNGSATSTQQNTLQGAI